MYDGTRRSAGSGVQRPRLSRAQKVQLRAATASYRQAAAGVYSHSQPFAAIPRRYSQPLAATRGYCSIFAGGTNRFGRAGRWPLFHFCSACAPGSQGVRAKQGTRLCSDSISRRRAPAGPGPLPLGVWGHPRLVSCCFKAPPCLFGLPRAGGTTGCEAWEQPTEAKTPTPDGRTARQAGRRAGRQAGRQADRRRDSSTV